MLAIVHSREAINANIEKRMASVENLSFSTARQHNGQSGRLGGAIAGHHGLIGLHLEAWGCPPHS